MASALKEIEQILLQTQKKPNAVKEAIASIERYRNGRISKKELVKQLRSYFIIIAHGGLLMNSIMKQLMPD